KSTLHRGRRQQPASIRGGRGAQRFHHPWAGGGSCPRRSACCCYHTPTSPPQGSRSRATQNAGFDASNQGYAKGSRAERGESVARGSVRHGRRRLCVDETSQNPVGTREPW